MNRFKMLKETFVPDFNQDDPVIKECIESFPIDVLTSAQRSLKIEMDVWRKRAIYLDSLEFNSDTSKEINMLQKDALRVSDNYEKAHMKFMTEKAQLKAKGNRRLNKTEKGELWNYKN